MIGSLITRGLTMIFGYAYPAYECYKTVETNLPEIEQLRFWCQYWILVAMFTVFERIFDSFISWFPLYSEAKLAFFIFLWHPKTKVYQSDILMSHVIFYEFLIILSSISILESIIETIYTRVVKQLRQTLQLLKGADHVYDSFFRPYVSKHEPEIDRSLSELKMRAGNVAVLYWQRAATYFQTTIFDVLQYVAKQSSPPATSQLQKQAMSEDQPITTTPSKKEAEEPPSK